MPAYQGGQVPCINYLDNQGATHQKGADALCYNYCRGAALYPDKCAAFFVYYKSFVTLSKSINEYRCCPASSYTGSYDSFPGGGEFLIVSQVPHVLFQPTTAADDLIMFSGL